MSPRTLIVADDLTGAQDTAIQLKTLGGEVAVALSMSFLGRHWKTADIWAIDTETRFLSPREAYKRVYDYLGTVRDRELFLYKKVDSTLRGNVGAEIEAALRASGKSVAVVASALPHGGRTVVDGLALVNGEPLHETECGRDPFTPVATSDVAALIATQTKLLIGRVGLATVRAGAAALRAAVTHGRGTAEHPAILVCDCETEADLAAVAGLADLSEALFVGSSGLASAFFAAGRPAVAAPRRPDGAPFLVVVGSLNSASHAQADRLAAGSDCVTITVDPALAAFAPDEARARAAAVLAAAPKLARRHILLRCGREPVAGGDIDALEAGRRIADCLARIAGDALANSPDRHVFMTGGEMAARFLKTVAAEGIRLIAEIEPGVPYGEVVGGDRAGRLLFSKAGGFGDADILMKIIEREDA